MFFDYRSTSLDPLVKKLSEQLSSESNDSPLDPNWIVVQNREAREWITYQLATLNGIAANIEFILPSELIWKLYRYIKQDLPRILPSDRLPMQWAIFELLLKKKAELRRAGFPFEIDNESLRLQVASQIADVFDLYQVYRPDMIRGWSGRVLSSQNRHERWQSVLWNMLQEDWKKEHQDIPDRSQAFFDLNEQIREGGSILDSIPEHVHVFGLSQASSPFLELLNTIAQKMQVHMYNGVFSNPDEIENVLFKELLLEWSASKRDTLDLLDHYKTQQIYLGAYDQNLFYAMEKNTSKALLEIHSCHNVKREVEVLKTELLGFFDDYPEVSPDEVLILVPDMEQYVPVIDSAFGFEAGEPSIPVGLPFVSNDNMNALLVNLIDLIQSDFKVSSVIDLLESGLIRSRFNLSIEDVSMVRSWLGEMNIYWGLEETDSGYSMERAIHSAFNGFTLETSEFTVYRNTVPFVKVNSTEKLIALSKVSRYIRCLKQIRKEVKRSHSANDWIHLLREWVIEIFDPERSKGLLLRFDNWKHSVVYVSDRSDISYSTFSEWVKGQLSDVSAGSGRLGNGVQLSTYIPFRGLPFKYVAILGLNEHVFPRNPVRPAFDLIHTDPKPGDRIMAKDDRLLFLETLFCTQIKLHISYIGKDQHSDSDRLPSILVQKLEHAIKSNVPEFEIKKHKLHGFDSSLFSEPKVYSNHLRKISEVILSEENSTPGFLDPEDLIPITSDKKEISVNDLISFFEHPCKYHAQNVLQISIRTSNVVLDDRENFKLDGLSRFLIRQEIVSGIDHKVTEKNLHEYLDVSGILPKGIPGSKLFKEQYEDIKELVDVVSKYRSSEADHIEVDIELSNVKLFGRVDDIYGSKRVIYRAGSSRAKDLIPLWIHHLICSVIEPEFKESILVFKEKKSSKTITSIQKLGEVNDPVPILEELILWFAEYHSDKTHLCFFPESSLEFVTSEEEASKLNMWHGTDHGYSGDGNDFYNELYWRGTEPLNELYFKENALKFWEPLLSFLTQMEPGE